jgi:hypothetical protein
MSLDGLFISLVFEDSHVKQWDGISIGGITSFRFETLDARHGCPQGGAIGTQGWVCA